MFLVYGRGRPEAGQPQWSLQGAIFFLPQGWPNVRLTPKSVNVENAPNPVVDSHIADGIFAQTAVRSPGISHLSEAPINPLQELSTDV